MRSNRGRDTGPELALRNALHGAGYRYRVDFPPGPDRRRRADIVFPRLRIAIFIDGCFWHSCPTHGTLPKTNADYWVPKLERNRLRDFETTRALEAEGWEVIRIWEHESITAASARVMDAVDESRKRLGEARQRRSSGLR
ncbi:very short patch repair endonuclease [Microbacterium testaceum]|uniref:very short patch repair endonuclease n=1 Tax=Microbacterium testaceum TaxID=2033 RepID=UPI003436A8F0